MELIVELSTGDVAVRDCDEMKHFSVRAVPDQPEDCADNGALGALAAALRVHDAGTVDRGGDVLVPVAAVRRLALGAAAEEGRTLGPDWDAGFSAMLEYAGRKGWITEDGAIRSHVEWGD